MKKKRDRFPKPLGWGTGEVGVECEVFISEPPPGYVSTARTLMVRAIRPNGERYWRGIPINRDKPMPESDDPTELGNQASTG